MREELRDALEQVARRVRRANLWGSLALCWTSWALIGLVLAAVGTWGNGPLASFAGLAVLSGLACLLLSQRSARDPRQVARRIEAKHPGLNAALLTAVERDMVAPPGQRGFLQDAVIAQALAHRRTHDWGMAVSPRVLLGAKIAHAVALGGLILVSAGLLIRARSGANDLASADASDIQVVPGDTEVERGSSLLVVARFGGNVPPEAKLVVDGGDPTSASHAMTRSLEDPTFAGRVESVGTDLSYRVEFAGTSSPTYRVRVFETPELLRTDAKLIYPGYTSLEPRTAEDIRHLTAVEGTEVTLLCRLNKEVASAKLVDEKGQEIALAPPTKGSPLYSTKLTLADPHRYKLQLVDRDGRRNKLAADLGVNVTRNRPPNIAMTQPAHDVRVSPVEELRLKSQVDDDFGVARHGVSFTAAGGTPREIVLSKGAQPQSKKVRVDHLIDFEGLKAAPDQLVTYFVWAKDVGPDGKPRRTDGDMFFAEVRHFEEIFRQGEAPSGSASEEPQDGEGGNAQEADKLAELQKEIINGTWKVIRRETSARPTAKLAADSTLLRDSQASAVEQAKALGGRLRDAASKASLEDAMRSMKDALTHLGEAVPGTSAAPLKPALVAEQAAYQALLKLRAREFEVVRSNSRQRSRGRASGASASQRQLDQLQLTNEDDRFEEQNRARPEQLTKKEQEQRETRQVVNRLRELSQRQADLNERLKELQSALEAAKDDPAKQEIERQLKRLRDEQKEILRDTDELQERMEAEPIRERMAEARQQVEEGREHVRQASEALEQGRLPQALTEGARAGRQLNDVRDDLRKQSSNAFSEDLTEMRDRAKKLDEDQGRLTERLEAKKESPRKALRDLEDRGQVKQEIEGQREKFEDLVERMRRTVGEAEETEPLLAKNLFDTVRKADEQTIPEALQQAEQLAEAGIPAEAAKASRHAGQGIEQLREGVERAARSVLGDETAALRRAQGEVEDLADQINRELAQADGSNPDAANRQGEDRQGAQQPGGQTRQGVERKDQPGEQGKQGQQPGSEGGQEPGRSQSKQQGPQGKSGGAEGKGGGRGPQGQEKGQQGQRGGQGPGSLRGGSASPGARGGGGGGGGEPSGVERLLEGVEGGRGGPGGPITGEGFRQWSDRMREVEELLEDPGLRAEAARIRDRVRGAREEFKRHAKAPDPTQLKGLVAEPIRELRDKIAQEVRRRESPDALVPIDRDPVPPRFAEGVRRYYERLGSGR